MFNPFAWVTIIGNPSQGQSLTLSALFGQHFRTGGDNRSANTNPREMQRREALTDLISDQDRYYPINRSIRDNLGPAEDIALSKTSKQHAKHIADVRRVAWNINLHLAPFFTNAVAFRSLQAKHNAFIVAPFSTEFFMKGYSNSRFDSGTQALTLFFEENTGENDMRQFLAQDGYELQTGVMLAQYVQLFHKSGKNKRTSVFVVSPPAAPLYSLLKSIAVTSDANFITWNKAYALFARSAFIDKHTYLLRSLGELEQNVFKDPEIAYRFKIMDRSWFDTKAITGPRSVGDTHTRIIKLDTTGVTPSSMPDYVLESAKFMLQGVPSSNKRWPLDHFTIKTVALNHPVLKYSYLHLGLNADPETQEFLLKLYDDLNNSTYLECMKISDEERSEAVWRVLRDKDNNARKARGTFPLPAHWKFWDDLVIRRFMEFENPDLKSRKKTS